MLVPHEQLPSPLWMRILEIWAKLSNAQRIHIVEFHRGNKQPLYNSLRKLKADMESLKLTSTKTAGKSKEWLYKQYAQLLGWLFELKKEEYRNGIRTITWNVGSRESIQFYSVASPEGCIPNRNTAIS